MAPAVLDAVAAFAYGMSRITDAFEAYERADQVVGDQDQEAKP